MEYPEAVWLPLVPIGQLRETTASGLDELIRTALNNDGSVPADRAPPRVGGV